MGGQGGEFARFTLTLRLHRCLCALLGRSTTRLTPLHHRGMHIAALTLNLVSRFSIGLRLTALATLRPMALLAEFPLRLALGGVPAVKMLGQLFPPLLHMDLLLISGGGAQTPQTSTRPIGEVLRHPHLGGGSNSSNINTTQWGSSSSSVASASSRQVSIHSRVPYASLAFTTSSLDRAAPGPTPLPVNRFTLLSIKTSADYLAAQDLIMYWLRRPGFCTTCSDAALITDSTNALASQFWEGQLRMALKDDPARFLFENTGSTFYDKGFEMLQVLEDNFHPSSISNTFTTLLSLFNDRQSDKDKEGIHKFRSRFEGHLSALSCSSVSIPHILQVMLFMRALHSRYQDLLNQFASKQKDLSIASIDSVVANAKFMDEFVSVGANGKASPPPPLLTLRLQRRLSPTARVRRIAPPG